MIEHLSYSSISQYLSCPAAWRYKYVLNLPMVVSPELAFGSAFHKTLQDYLTGKGTLIPLWMEAWNVQKESVTQWDMNTPEEFANTGVRILSDEHVLRNIYNMKAGKDEQGYCIEKKVDLHVPGVPIPIIGFIDFIDEQGIPCDIKTSGKSWAQDKAQGETQTLFYLAALNQAGNRAHGWRFKHYIFVKTKQPQVQVFEHEHKPGELFWLFQQIQQVWKGIMAEVFPCNSDGWKCSPKYCDFWRECRGKYEALP